ncbi:MAG: hypothetical protein M1820_006294 [Bogoriella megaspora]|nr:MAG: hypothetical protein M1820_006294 [Bogoriella megaspora]
MSSNERAHLEPSELGNKEYWDEAYLREIENHDENPDDEGTIWFDDSDAETKVLDYLNSLVDQGILVKSPINAGTGREGLVAKVDSRVSNDRGSRILDLGTGNGHMLMALVDDGWEGDLVGVDYSEPSIELARRIAEQREAHTVSYWKWDILSESPGNWLGQGFDIVLDKGTFDAISLSGEVDGHGRRVYEGYREKVEVLVREGGFLLVTSCNWTEAELKSFFDGGLMEYFGKVHYPSFTFGGVKGQTIITFSTRKPSEVQARVGENRRVRIRKSPQLTRKVRGRYGDEVVEDSAPLKIDSLGKQTEVIILRDADVDRSQEQPAWRSARGERKGKKEPLSQENIMSIVESEDQAPDQEQIDKNIEELRRSMGAVPGTDIHTTKSEFDEVFGILYNGYTIQQLAGYLRTVGEQSSPSTQSQIPHSIRKSIWKPGTTSLSERLPSETDSIVEPSGQKTQKGLLVDKIMRHVWNVHIQEIEENFGQLELTMRRWQKTLLTLGDNPVLESVGRARKAKIQLVKDAKQDIIRITADFRTAQNTARDLINLLSNVCSRHVDLQPFKEYWDRSSAHQTQMPVFHPRLVAQIAQTTKTHVHVSNNTVITINGLDQGGVEDAQRMILSLITPPRRAGSDVFIDRSQAVIRNILPFSGRPFNRTNIMFVRHSGAFPHVSRTKGLGGAIRQGVAETEKPTPESLRKKLLDTISIESPASQSLFRLGSDTAKSWNLITDKVVSATVGQILESFEGPLRITSPSKDKKKQSPRASRINFDKGVTFSSDVPGLLPFLSSLGRPAKKYRTTLELVLLPSPFTHTGPVALQQYPEVRIHFKVTPTSLDLHGIYATAKKSATYAAMLSFAADLKVENEVLLAGSRSLSKHPDLRRYCNELKKSFLEGNETKLRAPFTLRLPVPRVSDKAKTKTSPKNKTGTTKTHTEEHTIEYTLAELKQRQSIGFEFEGFRLMYTSIEGGKIGGNQDELKLFMYKPSTKSFQSYGTSAAHSSGHSVAKDADSELDSKEIGSGGVSESDNKEHQTGLVETGSSALHDEFVNAALKLVDAISVRAPLRSKSTVQLGDTGESPRRLDAPQSDQSIRDESSPDVKSEKTKPKGRRLLTIRDLLSEDDDQALLPKLDSDPSNVSDSEEEVGQVESSTSAEEAENENLSDGK